MKKSSQKKIAKAIAIIIAAMIFFLLGSATERAFFRQQIQAGEEAFILQTDGYTKANVSISLADLSFSSDCYRLTMTITNDQAFSIFRGIQKIVERPLTHDLIKDIIDGFEIKPIAARIEKAEDGLYYARLYLQKGGKVLALDSRPSDIAGISVRTGIRVYVKTEILQKNGTYIC